MKLLRLLIVALTLVSSHCAWQDFPLEVYLDSSFSNLEQQAIRDAAEEWNEFVGSRLAEPGPLILVQGVYEDDFNENDFGDDRHVVYRISQPGTDAEFLAEDNDGPISGHATLGDVVLFLYRQEAAETYAESIALAEGWQIDKNALRYQFVYNVALHEFGHLLGMTHYECCDGLMNALEPRPHDEDGFRIISDNDLRVFCEIYDCCRCCD